MTLSRKHKILFIAITVVMFHLGLLVVFGDNGLVELHRMHTTHADLVRTNERLTREISQMYKTIDRLHNDPAYIENVARQELGMIRSDELIFKFNSQSK